MKAVKDMSGEEVAALVCETLNAHGITVTLTGGERYARLLAAAMRTIAADPETPPPTFEPWSSVKSVDSLFGRVYKVPFLG